MVVKDINPGATDSLPGALTNVNGTLFFTADDGLHGRELWKSDGTEAGTTLVADINPGQDSSYPDWLENAKGTLFFSADDGVHGAELWEIKGRDTTPPDLAVPARVTTDATSPAGALVTYTVTATDDLDPSPTLTCVLPSGSFFPIGDSTVTCTATDDSGNSATATFVVHVRGAVEQLRDLTTVVNSLGPPATPQVKNGLNIILRSALNAVEADQPSVAASYLTTFIHQVGDLSKPPHPSLSIPQAQTLTSSANRIKTVLGYH
jgi:ELWxxDGT repeat protein